MARRTTRRKAQKDNGDDSWQQAWDARRKVLEKLLGPAEDGIYTSMFPIYLGGFSDVMTFRKYVKGYTYVTGGLTATSAQKRSKLGQYELMMCSRRPGAFVPNLLRELSHYTLERPIHPGDTVDIGESQPRGVTLRALLALEFDPPRGRFKLMGRKCGLLLLVGITAAELDAFRSKHRNELQAKLADSVLPYTDPKRKSVI